MYLLHALGINSSEELDPSRSLSLGPFELGPEATVEAIRILENCQTFVSPELSARTFQQPIYWAIGHATEGEAELFGFPQGMTRGLTTAIEIALVRAIAASAPDRHDLIFDGGLEIVIGSQCAYRSFRKLLAVVEPPLIGGSLLVGHASQVIVKEDIEKRLTPVTLNCLANSFRTAPLKFRFIELYRIMEACFLADVKSKLLLNFDAEPTVALNEALEALKSEMNQIMGLAETEVDAFEACWTTFDSLNNTNHFVTRLFRQVKSKGAASGGKAKTAAALIYLTRCAIVHAGGKNMIFENFQDGDVAIATVLPDLERAALSLIGVQLI